MSDVLVRFAPGLRPVLKHLKGQHDQQTHAGGGLSLPDGWSASRGDDRLLLDGPKNTKIVIDLTSGEPDEASLDLAVRTVNDLQNTFPVKDLTLVVSDKPFEEHEKANLIDKDALGFVMPTPDLQKTIHLRPAMLSQTGMEPMKLRSDDPSFFMASANDTPSIQYILTHEYGHVRDNRGSKRHGDAYELHKKGIVDISEYGSSNEAERWAESFTEYVLTNGKTTNATAQYFADKYFWDEGVTKSVTEFEQSVNVLIVDTFSDKKRPYIVETITKHGDHNQLMHGNRSRGGIDRADMPQVPRRFREKFLDELSAEGVSHTDVDVDPRSLRRTQRGLNPDNVRSMYDAMKQPDFDDKGDRIIVSRDNKVLDGHHRWAAAAQIAQERPGFTIGVTRIDMPMSELLGRATRFNEKNSIESRSMEDVGPRSVAKHGTHNQQSHGRRGGYGTSPAEEAQSQLEADMDYIMGRTAFPSDYTGYRPGYTPMLAMPERRLSDRVDSARRRIRRWASEREQRRLSRLSPAEIEEIKAANRARVAAQRERQVRVVRPQLGGFGVPALAKAFDPLFEMLERVLGDVVEPELWIALIEDGSPVAEMSGPLGDLLDEMLLAVLVDDAVVKHLQGKHDQMTHAHGKGGGSEGGAFSEWGDRAGRLRVAAKRGPSVDALNSLADGTYYDELAVSNVDESGIVESMLDKSMKLWMEGNAYRNPSQEEINAVREEKRKTLREIAIQKEKDALAYSDPDLHAQFDEVFAVEHTGVTKDGRTLTLSTSVQEVIVDSYTPSTLVKGSINDENGAQVGEFERNFSRNSDGELQVTHELMNIWDDNNQGTGFSKTFNAQAEDYYISHGIEKVRVHAALSGGGYAWATQGFDWVDPSHDRMGTALRRMERLAEGSSLRYFVDRRNPADFRPSPAEQRQAKRLVERSLLPVDDPDYPTPYEFAMVGYSPGDTAWAGLAAMRGANWYGTKTLTPQGRRRSESEMNPTGTLRPVLKHLQGQHDQQTHGKGGGGSATSERTATGRIPWGTIDNGDDFKVILADEYRFANGASPTGPYAPAYKRHVASTLSARMEDVSTEDLVAACMVPQRIGDAPLKYAQLLADSRDENMAIITFPDGTVTVEKLYGSISSLREQGYNAVQGGTPEAEQVIRQHAISAMVKQWATTSNDADVLSLSIQRAAEDEFDAKGSKAPSEYGIREIERNTMRRVYERVDDHYAATGPALRAFVRAQYDQTQEMFARAGVTDVVVHRGRTEPEDVVAAIPLGGQDLTARLRPLSSWATAPEVAENFAEATDPGRSGVVMTATVPVTRILSTPVTGVGCLEEYEVVVIGPSIEANMDAPFNDL